MIELLNNPELLKSFFLDKAAKAGVSLVIILISYFLIKWMDHVLAKLFDRTPWDEALEKFLQSLANGVAWIVVGLIVLSVFEVDLGPMIASLGIAGFVLGFALKDTLSNLASGVFLLINKPFTVGNYVEAGGVKGSVKKVGIAACTLTTPDNKKITIPNSSVWGSPITNYSAHKTRRMDIIVSVSYSDDIGKAVKVAQKVLNKEDRIRDEPESMVAVKELGDSSVNLVLRFWVNGSDYWPTKFDIMRNVKESFDANGISIPFPQRDVHIVSQVSTPKRKKSVRAVRAKSSKKLEGNVD